MADMQAGDTSTYSLRLDMPFSRQLGDREAREMELLALDRMARWVQALGLTPTSPPTALAGPLSVVVTQAVPPDPHPRPVTIDVPAGRPDVRPTTVSCLGFVPRHGFGQGHTCVRCSRALTDHAVRPQ